jgi:hypothetical protein
MTERNFAADLEKKFESLENKGTVAELVELLGNFYPNERPEDITGYISLIGRRETWHIGARLPEGLIVGISFGFWPEKNKVNVTVFKDRGASYGYPLDPEQEVRWQVYIPKETTLEEVLQKIPGLGNIKSISELLEHVREQKESGGVWDDMAQIMGDIYSKGRENAEASVDDPDFGTVYLQENGEWIAPEGRIGPNTSGDQRFRKLLEEQK